MLEEYTSNFCSLTENKDIRSLICNALFESLTECFPLNIIVKSMFAVKNLQLTISDTIFMNKMNKFLTNAFTDDNMQLKFSGLFEDEQKRKDAVKKVIQVIEKIDFDEKVDIFANLTRAVCMERRRGKSCVNSIKWNLLGENYGRNNFYQGGFST